MRYILVTGGSGFLGGLLTNVLLGKGFHCINVDIKPCDTSHPSFIFIQADIRDDKKLKAVFSQYEIEAVFHCATVLAHGHYNKTYLWETNVTATQYLLDLAIAYQVPRFIFISSNCLWGKNMTHLVAEEDEPCPVELYGKSKLTAEQLFFKKQDKIITIIFRCPTIIDVGRMGLLSILYEFIQEGRKIYLVGGGKNRYQFIYAGDLIDALIKSLTYCQSNIFNIGSDHVKTLADVFQYVIDNAGSHSRAVAVPKMLSVMLMKIAYYLHLSPLGPYHYKMIAEDFVFDTEKIKSELDWRPTLSNEEMLWCGYQDYVLNPHKLIESSEVSPHKKPASMRIIRLLKWLS